MKLLLLNPNTSEAMTERMTSVARVVASPGVQFTVRTAPRGFPYIASRAEADIAAGIVLEMLAEHGAGHDAAIIAAFGDPGLFGARELASFPVLGLAESAMLTACMLGARFAIVTFSPTLVAWFRDGVARDGLASRSAGVFAAVGEPSSLDRVQEDMEDRLVAAAERAVNEADADVIVLGGAPLAGLAARVKHRIAVPVVDCVAAAVKQAEALVALAPRKPAAGSFRKPAGKPSVGLAQSLADLIAAKS